MSTVPSLPKSILDVDNEEAETCREQTIPLTQFPRKNCFECPRRNARHFVSNSIL